MESKSEREKGMTTNHVYTKTEFTFSNCALVSINVPIFAVSFYTSLAPSCV